MLNYTLASELYPQDAGFTVQLPEFGLGSMGNYEWDDVKAPYHTGWSPTWSTDQRAKLGLGARLGQTSGWSFIEATYPWQRQYGLHGLCMQNPDGQYEGGLSTSSLNLPAFTVTARSASDVAEALKFAAANNIQVVVKNTGHSYHSGSTAAGSLMIWTAFLPKYGTVLPLLPSCHQHRALLLPSHHWPHFRLTGLGRTAVVLQSRRWRDRLESMVRYRQLRSRVDLGSLSVRYTLLLSTQAYTWCVDADTEY